MRGSTKKVYMRFIVVVFGFLVAFFITMSRANADDTATSEALVTVTSTCRLGAVIDSSHQASITAGTYQADIGKTTISAQCNDVNGFDVYAIGYTNTEFGRNDMLGTTTGRTMDTGTATSGKVSGWAMKLNPVASAVAPTITTGYEAYHAVPDDYIKVATYANSTMAVDDGSEFETTYAVYASSSQAPDIYSGKVKYTLVHPSDAASAPCKDKYTIVYDSNGGSGNIDSQTACVDRAIGLLPSGFTPPVPASEYQFAAWNTEPDGSGYMYYARQSVTNLASANESITLYAQWAPKYMQDMTRSMCQIVASENPYTVYDRRDGSDYTIQYVGGACWMTQNLRITGVINREYSNFTNVENYDLCSSGSTSGTSTTVPKCQDSGDTIKGFTYNIVATTVGQVTGATNKTVAINSICPKNWVLPFNDADRGPGSSQSVIDNVGRFMPAFSSTETTYWTDYATDRGYRVNMHLRSSNPYIGYDAFGGAMAYVRCVRTQ